MCLYDKNVYLKEQNPCVLSAEDERRLVVRHLNGDVDATAALISSVQHVINYVIKKHINKNIGQDDLYQECLVAAIKAIDDFDVKRNVRFTTFVKFRFLNAVGDYVNKNAYCAQVYKTNNERKVFFNADSVNSQELSYNDKVSRLVELTGVGSRDVERVLGFTRSAPLDFKDVEDKVGCVASDVESNLSDELSNERLYDALSFLDDMAHDIVTSYYLGGENLTDIASRLGYSKQHVTTLRNRAIDKLSGILKKYKADAVNG